MFSFVPFCSCVFQCPGSVNRILWAHSAFLHYLLLPLNGECVIISNVESTIVKIYQMFVHSSEHFLCQATNIIHYIVIIVFTDVITNFPLNL